MTSYGYGAQNDAKIAGTGGAVMATPAKRADPEHQIQAAYFEWVRAQVNPDYRYIFAVPNGTASTPVVGAYMKAEGVERGVEDILIMFPKHIFSGAALETKAPGGVVSAEQKAWHLRHRRAGYYVEVCYSVEALIEATEWYLGGEMTHINREKINETFSRISGERNREITSRHRTRR